MLDNLRMKKLGLVLLGALIAFPLGALTRDAVAERRRVIIISPLHGAAFEPMPESEYRHLSKADDALHDALSEINASQRANEGVWSDRTGRAKDAREAVEKTVEKLDQLIDWASPVERPELPR